MKKCSWCDNFGECGVSKRDSLGETKCIEYENEYVEHLLGLIEELTISLECSNEVLCDTCDNEECDNCDCPSDRILIKNAKEVNNG